METQIFDAQLDLHLLKAKLCITKLYYFQEKRDAFTHAHSHLEFHYCLSGSCVFTLDFGTKITIYPGEWLLLGKDVYHEEIVEDRCSGYCLGIELFSVPEDSPLTAFERLPYFKGADSETAGYISRIFEEKQNRETGYEESCQHLFCLLLIHLMRSCKAEPEKQGGEKVTPENKRSIIDNFFNCIFRYVRQEYTVEALAKELHVSSRHVNRLLQKYYGMTFQQKLLNTKMKFTEYLLLNTGKSVSEISEICDLSETYLIRSFKGMYHMTPTQYRKRKSSQENQSPH